MKTFVYGALGAASMLVASVSHAESPDARRRAAEQFEEGKRAFASGQFVEAAEHFQQAALIAPHPAALINAAEAWERAGDAARAVELCDRIAAAPYADARFVDAALAMSRRLSPRIATVDVTGPEGGKASIDGSTEVPIPHRFRLRAGKHEAMLTDSARRVRKVALDVAAGESRVVDPGPTRDAPAVVPPRTSPPAEPAPAPPPPSSASGSAASSAGTSVIPWISFGVAAAAAGVGGYFAVQTIHSRDDYRATANRTTSDAFYRNRLIANVGLFGAAAFAVTGVVLLVVAPSRTTHVALVPSRDAAVLVGRIAF